MKPHRISIPIFVLLALSIVLSACGPSPEQLYLEKLNAPFAAYNAKFNALSGSKISEDINDPAWKAEIFTALDELDKAAVELGSAAGEAPESCAALDGYVTEIAGNTGVVTKSFRDLIAEAENLNNEANQRLSFFKTFETIAQTYIEKLSATNAIFNIPDNPADPDWQSKSAAAINELEQAANDLGNISDVPEPFISTNETLKQAAAETNNLTKSMREMLAYFASGDNEAALTKMQEVATLYQNIGNIMMQIDASNFVNIIPSDESLNTNLKETENAISKLTEIMGKANSEIAKFDKK